MQIWLIITIIIALVLISIYNHLAKLSNQVRNSKSGIDVYLQQRFDTIPSLIEITKNYSTHERDVLEKITELRTSFKDNINAANELNAHFERILAIAESYPDLKASQNFIHLQRALVKIENQLQAARRIYNHDATKLNIAICVFPNNIFAHLFGIRRAELFVAASID